MLKLTTFVAWSSLIFCGRFRVARIGSYLGHSSKIYFLVMTVWQVLQIGDRSGDCDVLTPAEL